MYLSTHFTLAEMVKTSHREVDNHPNLDVISRLRSLCIDLLEPTRLKFGPLWITSGYRCHDLNDAIGGARNSAHTYGCAADFVPMAGSVTPVDVVSWLMSESGLLFDQVIDEYSSTSNWVHLGSVRPRGSQIPRLQALTMRQGRYSRFEA